jgi:hypothetical protein
MGHNEMGRVTGAKGHVPARSFQYGVVVAEILKQRRKRTQPMADARADKASVASPFAKSFTPRDDMRGSRGGILPALDAGERHEVFDGVFVGALRAGVADILEPLDLAGNGCDDRFYRD